MGFNWGNALKTGLTGAATGFVASGFNPLGAVAGLVGGGLLGGFSSNNPYSQVGRPSDVRNINPYTAEAMDRFRSDYGFYRNNLTKYLQGADTYGGEVDRLRRSLESYKFGVEYDPLAAQRLFLSQTPELQQLARRSIDTSSGEEQARRLAGQAIQQVASQYAGGGLRSGAALRAMTEGAAIPLGQYQVNRENLIGNLLGNLYGQSFQGLQQGTQYKAGLDLQAQQLGYGSLLDALRAAQSQQAFQGQLANLMQSGALGSAAGIGHMGAPTFWQPTYVPNPDYMSNSQLLGSGLLMGAQLGTNLQGVPPSILLKALGLGGSTPYRYTDEGW